MEFLLATQELCEMSYPADTVEVALVYTNTEKAKVWVWFFLYCVDPCPGFLHLSLGVYSHCPSSYSTVGLGNLNLVILNSLSCPSQNHLLWICPSVIYRWTFQTLIISNLFSLPLIV